MVHVDSHLLPPVCPNCRDAGTRMEDLYFRDPFPLSLWLTLKRIFIVLLLLLSLGAVLTWIILGAKVLTDYSTGVAIIMAAVVVGAGVRIGRSASNRGRWRLSFSFCGPCAKKYRKLRWGLIILSPVAVLSLMVWPSLALIVLLSGGLIALNWLGIMILVSSTVILASTVTVFIMIQRFRGITARWDLGQSVLEIEFRDQGVFDLIRKRMSSVKLVADPEIRGFLLAMRQMDESEFEAELNRLEALAESYEIEMYEAHDLTTATGHYSNMKDCFYDAIGLARRAGRSDHVERLEKRLSELQQIFRYQLSTCGYWTGRYLGPSSKRRKVAFWISKIQDLFIRLLNGFIIRMEHGFMIEAFRRVGAIRHAPFVLKSAAQKALKELQGDTFRELDVVEVIKLLKSDRTYTGTEGVCRPPKVGDTGTIVFVHNSEEPNVMFSIECVYKNGATLWLADFFPEELRRVE